MITQKEQATSDHPYNHPHDKEIIKNKKERIEI